MIDERNPPPIESLDAFNGQVGPMNSAMEPPPPLTNGSMEPPASAQEYGAERPESEGGSPLDDPEYGLQPAPPESEATFDSAGAAASASGGRRDAKR